MFFVLIFKHIAILMLKQGNSPLFTSVKSHLKYVNMATVPTLYEYSVFCMKIFGASAWLDHSGH